ncbi:unnamed protein product, partial [Rangifer tarandus platyrhynchus]
GPVRPPPRRKGRHRRCPPSPRREELRLTPGARAGGPALLPKALRCLERTQGLWHLRTCGPALSILTLRHHFDPWSGKFPPASEQLSRGATATEPASGARRPQLRRPTSREPVLHERSLCSEKPAHAT